MTRAGVLTLAIFLAQAISAQQASPKPPSTPEFAEFPAPPGFKGAPAPPVLFTSLQRSYRTTIRREAAKGPNFAGHYRIIDWMCGSDCVGFVIADSQTGKVYDPPFQLLDLPPAYVIKDRPYGIEYEINSRLLKVGGCPEEQTCGSFYYEWTGAQWKLLYSEITARVRIEPDGAYFPK